MELFFGILSIAFLAFGFIFTAVNFFVDGEVYNNCSKKAKNILITLAFLGIICTIVFYTKYIFKLY